MYCLVVFLVFIVQMFFIVRVIIIIFLVALHALKIHDVRCHCIMGWAPFVEALVRGDVLSPGS
jgi:hypothetical protein